MLEERKVVVVGGGRVGQRKVELLLDAGADVTLVCPDCVAELGELAISGAVKWLSKRFEAVDLQSAVMVFACTDDKNVNRHILEVAKLAHVPCCCADGNWPDGDFVTPAILRDGQVLISVSTSGKSCRQSRLIKDNLSKHLSSIASSDLLVLGISHEQVAMEARVAYHQLWRERETLGAMISQVWGVHEFFLLNTCNRVELVVAIAKESATSGILRRIMRFDELWPDQYYMKFGYDAYEHVCSVIAGIRSQTPGEFHIVSQVKEAVDEACARGWGGSIIRELCDTMLKVSREIRRIVEPLLDVTEIEEVCMRYMLRDIKALSQKTVLVAGTGVVGRGLIDGLHRRGVRCIWGYHANVPANPPNDLQNLIQFDELDQVLPDVDVVVSAVDVESPLISHDNHQKLLKRDSPVTLIDLGIPRNIDPALGCEMKNVEVVDLDMLKNWHRESAGTLEKVMNLCAEVVERNRGAYERIRDSMQGEL